MGDTTSAPDYDVLVVGAGGAGLAAAVTAAEAGRSVLVVEAAETVGGSTALSGGSFMAAGTAMQAEAGYFDDTADDFFDHYLTFNRWDVEPSVVRRFCEEALPTLEWLAGLGVQFPADRLYRATRENVPRSHRPVGGGAAIVAALKRAATDSGVDIAVGRRVDELLVGADGAARGVRADGEEVTGRAVVVTTGGFGADLDLVRAHIPDATGEEIWSPAADTCRGDGLALAATAGAELVGQNRGDLLLTAGLVRDIEPFPPTWLVIVGRYGRRFVDESAPYAVVTPLAQQHGPSWVLLDDRMLRTAHPDPKGAWGAGTWTTDVLLAARQQGRIDSADTIEELATIIGLPAAALAGSVRRYNDACRRGHDSEFRKDPAGLVPIGTPPFHAVRLWPAVVAVTGYGVRIDTGARALRALDGEPVPGLYAAGEVTGNVIGPQYLGGGNAIGSALIFGRIAGQSATSQRVPRAA